MPQDVQVTGPVAHLEVPVIRREPTVEDVNDLDLSPGVSEPARRFLSPVAGVAVDLDVKEVPWHSVVRLPSRTGQLGRRPEMPRHN